MNVASEFFELIILDPYRMLVLRLPSFKELLLSLGSGLGKRLNNGPR